MKKYNLIFWSALLLLASCDYGKIDGYKEGFAPGGPVKNVFVSPSSLTLYVDSDLPKLAYNWVPASVDDTTVTWSSDKPEILDIDPKTGEMSWGTIRNSDVVITVTSNSSGAQAHCAVTVKNVVGVYRYLDLRKEVGLWMLDRNIGASEPCDPAKPGNDKQKGNYYQYGLNAAVANMSNGGADSKGGAYKYMYNDKQKELKGGFPAFDPYWQAEGPKFMDWTKPENTPGPKGWRLPTKAELEKIAFMSNEGNFTTAKDKGAARLLLKKMLLGISGYCSTGGPFPINSYGTGYLWSSSYDPTTKKAWCLVVEFANAQTVQPPKVQEISVIKDQFGSGISMPIRCVKDGDQGVEN